MSSVLVLVHTIPTLVQAFSVYCREELPGVACSSILDEPLLQRVRERGHIDTQDDERLLSHVEEAASIDAAAVVVTCSTVSDAVAHIRERAPIPVIAADEALAACAVDAGPRIALIATAASTLEPSRSRLQRAAKAVGRSIEIESCLVDGALSSLMAGDAHAHDDLVIAAVRHVAPDTDVVVLAQATMARVLPMLAADPPPCPVLASPRLALAEARQAILSQTGPALLQHEV